MNKFAKLLSGSSKEIRGARATILADDARFAQEELVRNLEAEKRELNRKLVAATDLYPESELSLMVTRKDFDPKAWTKRIQELKVAIAEKQVELDLATETFTEWFEDDKSKKEAGSDK